MISWLKKEATLISSLIIWNSVYEPYQIVVLRTDDKNRISLIYFVQLDHEIVAFRESLSQLRTNTEEEISFHIARIAREFIDLQNNLKTDGPSFKNTEDKLLKSLEEVFLSQIAIELMREKHPDYGYYSNSPNLRKLNEILLGTYKGLFDPILQKVKGFNK